MYRHLFSLYTPPVIAMVAGLFLILIFSYIIVGIHKYRSPDKNFSEILRRLWSWWFLLGGLAIALAFTLKGAIVCLALVSGAAFYEFFKVIPLRDADKKVLWWLFAAIPIQFFWAWSESFLLFQIFIPVFVFFAYPIRMILTGVIDGFVRSLGVLYWGSMITIYSFSHIAYLMILGKTIEPYAGPAGPLLYLLFLTQFNDGAQYYLGQYLGKHRITKNVCPSKTWEGLFAGMAATVLMSVLLYPLLLSKLGFYPSIFAGVLISTAGFFGDIIMSAIKRDVGVKEFSELLPGHGGLLDRIDSLTYTAPLFFYYVLYFTQ